MKKAVLIYGPESSGNRVMKRIIAANGYQITNDDTNPGEIKQFYPNLVHGHSIPANGNYFSCDYVRPALETRNYDIKTILLVRDWMAMSKSQVKRRRVPNIETAYEQIKCAYEMMFNSVQDPYIVVVYESLIRYPYETLVYIGEFLGHKLLPLEEIYDGNKKYFT